MTGEIRRVHATSRGTYGAPRIQAELAATGTAVSRKQVARLMRGAGVRGVSRRKRVVTTQRAVARRPAPDLVQRAFTAAGPNRLWVADITYIPTLAGWLYLAVVLDVWSRRVVGWAMATHLRTTLVLAALDMASCSGSRRRFTIRTRGRSNGARLRRPVPRSERAPIDGVGRRLLRNATRASSRLECELLDRTSFPTPAAAQPAVFEFIEGWYNTRRRHSALGYVAPLVFEQQHQAAAPGVDAAGPVDALRAPTSPLDHALRACPTAPTPTTVDTNVIR